MIRHPFFQIACHRNPALAGICTVPAGYGCFIFSINVADPGKENIFCTAEITLHVEKFIFCIIIFCETDLILFQKRSAIKFSPDIRKCPGGKEAAKLKFLRISMISGKRCVADCRQHFSVPESRIIGNYNICICLLCHTDITLHDGCIRKIIIRIQKQHIFSLCLFQPLISRLTDFIFSPLYHMDAVIFFLVISGDLFTLIRRFSNKQKQFPVFVILAYHTVQCFRQIFFCLIDRHDHRYFSFFFAHSHFFLTFFHIF